MTSQHHEITSFFVDASKALEELPHVKGKLSQIEEELAICRDINHGKDNRIADQDSHIKALQADIDDLKRARDDAELAAMEAKDQAEKLISSIRGVMKGAEAADSILNPPPAPLPPTSNTTEGSAETGEASSASSSASVGGEDHTSSTHSGTDSSEAAQAPKTWMETHYVEEGHDRPLDAPSIHGETSQTAETTSALSSGSATMQTKPHAGKDYWTKPDDMTWRQWVDGGGECAPYIHLDHDGYQV